MDEGKIGRISTGNSDLGVRPTVYVDLSRLNIGSGSGSKDNPYQLLPTGSVAVAPVVQETVAEEAPVEQEPVEEYTEPQQSGGIPIIDFSDEENLTDDPELYPAGMIEEVDDSFYYTGEEDDEGQDESPAQSGGIPLYVEEPDDAQGFTGTVDQSSLNEHYPALTAQGFLPDGQNGSILEKQSENGNTKGRNKGCSTD